MLAGYGRVLAGIPGSARYAFTSLIILSVKRVEGSFKVPRPKVSSMMASIDKDVEISSLTDQDDVRSGVSNSGQNKNKKYHDSSGSKTFDSGRVVSRIYSDDRDFRDRSEMSPHHGRDYRDYDNKRSRYVILESVEQIDVDTAVVGEVDFKGDGDTGQDEIEATCYALSERMEQFPTY
ncbi:hypothetical protein Tco_1292964 [Tanacetum coccineum]